MKYIELTDKQKEKFRQALIDGIIKRLKWGESTPAVHNWLHAFLEEMQPTVVPEEWQAGIKAITWR